MDVFLLYLWTRLDPLHVVFNFLMYGGGFATYFCVGWYWIHDKPPIAVRMLKYSVAALIVGVIALVIVPSKKDAALILAGSAVLDVARSETAGRLASKSVQLIEQTLDGYLKTPAKDSK